MPLPRTYAKGVLFVGRKPFDKPPSIVATAFLVGMDPWHTYVVTANHVVEGVDDTFVRIRMKDGSFKDEPVPDWVPNTKHDVSVASIDLPDNHDLIGTDLDQFIDTPEALAESDGYGEIELGDPVYFIGLLGKVRAMTERNVPLVRTGFLGALMQENVPVRRPGEKTKLITAHLIDCRSFNGFSGSPCYLQKTRARVAPIRDTKQYGVTLEYRTLLLGLIGGHFDDWALTQSRDVMREAAGEDEGTADEAYEVNDDIRAPVSTGVGYVIPAEFIRETLMREELADMRKRAEEEAAAAEAPEDDENAATEDLTTARSSSASPT